VGEAEGVELVVLGEAHGKPTLPGLHPVNEPEHEPQPERSPGSGAGSFTFTGGGRGTM